MVGSVLGNLWHNWGGLHCICGRNCIGEGAEMNVLAIFLTLLAIELTAFNLLRRVWHWP